MSNCRERHYTGPTTNYWQEILPPRLSSDFYQGPPFKYGFPAILPDNRILMLPIRQLPLDPTEAVASLIINQASITIVEELGIFLADTIRDLEPDVIVGLPTLGLSVAAIVARELGLARYVPLGYSRKFWYADELSTTLTSTTSPDVSKRVYLDPNQLPLLKGSRVVIIDDAVSSGTTLKAVWDFINGSEVGAIVLGAGVVMLQGERWKSRLGDGRVVRGVFESPLLKMVEDGWGLRV